MLHQQSISPYAPHAIEKPVMRQRWQYLTFLHWRYHPQVIQDLLPSGLICDTFDGSAWVALAPFQIASIEWTNLPQPPQWLSTFPETNVRTYVIGPDGKPGVWFFTLEADRLLGVLGARTLYHLPYRWAAMNIFRNGNLVEYRSRRLSPFGQGETDLAIEVGSRKSLSDLDRFLTARYRLYAVSGSRIAYADIEHEPWPWQEARVLRLRQDLVQHSGVPPVEGVPLVHYSEDLEVKVDRLKWF